METFTKQKIGEYHQLSVCETSNRVETVVSEKQLVGLTKLWAAKKNCRGHADFMASRNNLKYRIYRFQPPGAI